MLFTFSLSYVVTLLLSLTVVDSSRECVLNPEQTDQFCGYYCNSINCQIGYCSGDSCECRECVDLSMNNYENEENMTPTPSVEINSNEDDSKIVVVPTTTITYENDDTNTTIPMTTTTTTVSTNTVRNKWFRNSTPVIVWCLLVICILLAIALIVTCVWIFTVVYKKPVRKFKSRKSRFQNQNNFDGTPLQLYDYSRPAEI